MNLKDIKMKNVLYYMQSFVITAKDKSFEVPRSMILTVEVSKDYETMLYPLWYVCVNVPLWFYSQITKNPNDISVSMNLQYRLASNNEQLISGTNLLTTEVAGKFKAVIPHTTQIGDHSIQKNVEKQEGAHNKNYTYSEYAIVELSLYNSAAYAASFNKLNAVLSSTNLTNALTYCLNRCGINNVLLSKSDNSKTYSEFKIWPHSGMSNILRIVEDYKFHNSGSTIFFDLTDAYIISRKIGCNAWRSNEYKDTYILSLSETDPTLGSGSGIFMSSKDKYNALIIRNSAFSTQDVSSSPVLKNSNETEIFQFVTKDAIMRAITPNKEFVVSIDSPDHQKYNGKYRLYSMSVNMVPMGEFLEPQFMVTLRR